MQTLPSLLLRRRNLRRRFLRTGHILKGTIMEYERTCGSPNCRCMRGHKHRATYLSISQKNKTRLVYIRPAALKQVREWSANYKKLKELIEQLAQVNTEILRRTK